MKKNRISIEKRTLLASMSTELNLEEQEATVGSMRWEGRRQSTNVIDCRATLGPLTACTQNGTFLLGESLRQTVAKIQHLFS